MELSCIRFSLVDPMLLSERTTASMATVMVVSALYHGDFKDIGSDTPMRERVKAFNHNLGEMAHTEKGRRSLERRSTVAGTWLCAYCARCGARLHPNKCSRCGVSFELSIFSRNQPNIPPKLVKYVTTHGHKFLRRPPQA